MAVCPDLVIIISRSDEPPFAKDQPREDSNCVKILNLRLFEKLSFWFSVSVS